MAQAAAGLHRGLRTFAERTPSVAPGAVWSKAAARAAVAMSADSVPIERIRLAFGVGWNTVMRAVVAAVELVAPVRATRVGIDKTVMTTGRLTTRRRQFLDRAGVLETSLVVAGTQGRDRAAAVRLLAEHAPDAQVVTVDLFSGFKSAAPPSTRPSSRTCSISFAWRCRRWPWSAVAAKQQIHGHRSHKHGPLFRLRRLLRHRATGR